MVRYFYSWTPLVIVGTVVLLSLPWLGVVALMVAALGALGTLALAIAWAMQMLSLAMSRRRHGRTGARPALAPALVRAGSRDRPTQLVPTGATVLLAAPPSERDA